MFDVDTFLTTLHVMVDDFCEAHLGAEPTRCGRPPSLSRSEVITLIMFAPFWRFRSERDFYRYAQKHLRAFFPTLPNRSQFNRLARRHYVALVQFFHYLVQQFPTPQEPYEILDTTGVPIRNVKRRSRSLLAGLADIGYCTRLGWFSGFWLLYAVTPLGIITGFGFGSASTKDQPLADTLLACRRQPHPHLPTVGQPCSGYYLADTGFEGAALHRQWVEAYQAYVLCKPRRTICIWLNL